MRKLILATCLLSALTAGAQGFVTPRAQVARQQAEIRTKKAMSRGQATTAEPRGFFFVDCDEGTDAHQVANDLKTHGAQIRVVRRNQILLDAPYSKLEAMSATKGVMKIDVGSMVVKKTDVNRRVTQAAEVNEGTAPQLPQAYTGKGVIVGLPDSGFDFTHPMFKDKDGNLRIKGVYKPGIFSSDGDSVIVDGNTLTGSAYSKAEDILDTLKVKDPLGSHGGHCASIAAGSIMSDVKGTSGNPLGGIAPEADILLCDISDTNASFMEYCEANQLEASTFIISECLEYLNAEAKKAKKPLVVSLSANSHIGWHDGTSAMARIIGNYVKDENAAMMLCSSNEGGYLQYIDAKLKANDTLRVYGVPMGYAWGGMKTTKNVKMEVCLANWRNGEVICKIPVTYNSDPTKGDHGQFLYFHVGEDADNSHLTADEAKGVKEIQKYIESGDMAQFYCYQNVGQDENGNPYTYSEVYMEMMNMTLEPITTVINGETTSEELCFMLCLIPEEDTELHLWGDCGTQLQFRDDQNHVTRGDSRCSVGDWNTSGEPVSVGAWCANGMVQYEGTPAQESIFKAGDVGYFSSYGTDLAGHKHPDVCAPGCNVVAALNSFDPDFEIYGVYLRKDYTNQFTGQSDKRTYQYGTMTGTSMATPAAAGVVALWMQAAADMGKTLNSKDIKDIINHSSDTDEFTEASPERFGAGKINAYKGLLYVLGIDTKIQGLSHEQPRSISFRVSGDLVYADGAADGTPVAVYNLQGVRVSDTCVQGGTISLSGLPQGVYALQLGKLGSTLIRK